MHLYAITGGSMSIDSKDIEAIAKYWDERSQYFDEEHNTEDLSLWSQELMKLLKEDNGDVKKILDIGTGTGFLALLLAGNGYDVTGVDISKEMMELGKKKAVDCGCNIDFKYSLCEDMPFGDNEFDVAVNARVIWTLTDPVKALNEWKRVVNPGGKVISFMRVMKTDGSSYYTKEDGEIILPLSNATREDYVKVYEDAGYENIEVIELPEEMSHADYPHWTAFVGVVPQ